MIRLKNITKEYENNIKALSNVSFRLEKGTITGVIGRNGAGKSTLFKIIAGVIEDYSGVCSVDGLKSSLELSYKISYLPEVRGLDGRMQVIEHLTDMVCYKGIKRKEAEKNVLYWLGVFELEEMKYKKINTLSKGNQQKLQFILSLASNPEILILDEPFSGLDPITSDLFWDIILRLKKEGKTIIFSTHNLSDKVELCDNYLFLLNGYLAESGSLKDIKSRYNMILELKNNQINCKKLKSIEGVSNVKEKGDTYYISIENKKIAEKIFNNLEFKYSSKFYLRELTIQELFREINKTGDIYDS